MTGTFALLRQGFIVSTLLLVAACSDGGGGGPTPPDNNQPPLADATLPPSESMKAGESVTLSAAESSDADGAIASVAWEQLDGPAIDIADPSATELVFTAPAVEADGEIVLRLTVTDDEGESDSVEITLPVHAVIDGNENPVADAGADAQFSAGAGVTLNAAASTDADGQVVAWAWTQIAGPEVALSGAGIPNPTFLAPSVETETALRFRVVVTDDRGTTHSDVVTITLVPHTGGNRAPLIGGIEGIPTEPVTEGGNIALAAAASDPDEDEVTFAWELVEPAGLVFEGVEFPVSGAELALTLPDVTEDTPVTLRLAVSDGNLGDTRDIDFMIDFDNQAPTLDIATAPETLLETGINEGQAFTLVANAVDPDGKAGLTFEWNQTAGNVDLSGVLENITGPELALTAPEVASDQPYGFTVTVTDADGASVTSEEILFSVNFVNQAPVANAGPDRSSNEGTNVTLAGDGSADPDGEVIGYAWTQTAGPAATFITFSNVPNPTVALPQIDAVEATLTFALVVTDIHGTPSVADLVDVTVHNLNQRPIVSIQPVLDPVDEGSTFNLDGSESTDPDGVEAELTYQWTVPQEFSVVDATAPILEVTDTPDITEDTDYIFSLRVTDADNDSDTAETSVTLRFINQRPELTAADITGERIVTEGTEVHLTAAGSDPDGQDLGYAWTRISGPEDFPAFVEAAGLQLVAPEIAGIDPVTVTYSVVANDGSLESEPPVEIELTIQADQSPPEIIAPQVLDVDEGTGISFALSPSVTDNKTAGEALEYAWTVPNGFDVQEDTENQRELVITGTPDVGPQGDSGTFGFTVDDADGNSASVDFEITVNFVNQQPVVNSVGGVRTVNESTAGLTLVAEASDSDGQAVTYEWARTDNSGAAIGVTFPFEGKTLTYNTPDVEADTQLGFLVTAKDELGLPSDPVDVSVTISADPAPVIESVTPGAPALDEGATLDIAVTATDMDSANNPTAPEDIQYQWLVPNGFTVSETGAATLNITSTPNVGPAGGDFTFRVTVTDPDQNSVSQDINVHVGFVNQAPSVGEISITDSVGTVTAVDEGDVDLAFSINASDPDGVDGQALDYQWTVPQGFVVVGGTESNTLTVTSTPNVIQDENFEFAVTVSDGTATPATRTAALDVHFLNQQPMADAGSTITHSEDADLSGIVLDGSDSSDADIVSGATQTLTYIWTYSTDSGLILDGATESGGISTVQTGSATVAVVALPDVTADTDIPVTLVVNDGSGAANAASAPAMTTITVVFQNQPPRPQADNVTVAEDTDLVTQTMLLDAGATLDPDNANGGGQLLSYRWTYATDSGIALEGSADNGDGTSTLQGTSSTARITAVPNVNGDTDIPVTLVVNDGLDDSAPLEVIVSVGFINRQPDAGTFPDLSLPENTDLSGNDVTLAVTGFSDPDIEDGATQALTYNWTYAAASGLDLAGATDDDSDGNLTASTAAPFVVITSLPDVTGDAGISVTLVVDDGSGETNARTAPVTGTLTVTFVNAPPTVTIDPVDPVVEGASVTLNADAADPEGNGIDANGYGWTQTAGTAVTLADPTTANPTFTAPPVGLAGEILTFTVIAKDVDGLASVSSAPVNVQVDFVNRAPRARAGADQSVLEGEPLILDANASSDPDVVEGDSLEYRWENVAISGSPAAPGLLPAQDFSANATYNTTAPDVNEGGATYVFTLSVRDAEGVVRTDDVNVYVGFQNDPPVISSITGEAVNEGGQGTLAVNATDGDGQILTYAWTTADPRITDLHLADPANGSAAFTAPDVGRGGETIIFNVSVSDGEDTATDVVSVPVNFVNRLPTASAGADRAIIAGEPASLVGAAGDPDGEQDIRARAWTSDASNPATGFTFADAGNGTATLTYTDTTIAAPVTLSFDFTVTDLSDESATDTMTVVVNPAQNTDPSAVISGPESAVTEGETFTLNGAGSTDDGAIQAYAWSHVSGPAIEFDAPSTQTTTARVPNVGSVGGATTVVQLIVEDDRGGKDVATFSIPVNFANNAPQVTGVSASATSVNEAPSLATPITLDATATDADVATDGDALTYQWTVPAGYTVTGANTASLTVLGTPDVTADRTDTFSVQATDRQGDFDEDAVDITVNFDSQAPTANAGPSITVAPDSTGNALTGIAADPDGEADIVSRVWSTDSSNPDSIQVPLGAIVIDTNDQDSAAALDIIGVSEGSFVPLKFVVTDAEGNQSISRTYAIVQTAGDEPTANIVGPIFNGQAVTSVPEGATNNFTLQGSASTPASGSTISAYRWKQISGPPATITDEFATNANVIVANVGNASGDSAVFELFVADANGKVDSTTVEVAIDFVNTSPQITTPAADASLGEGDILATPVAVTVIADDADIETDGDMLTYEWTVPPGFTVTGEDSPTLTILGTPDLDGLQAPFITELFTVAVSDVEGLEVTESANVTVNFVNEAPSASAGPDQVVAVGTQVVLNGSDSDPDDPVDGSDIAGRAWTVDVANSTVDPGVAFSDLGDGTATLDTSGMDLGDAITFVYTVTDAGADGLGEKTATDSVIVTINSGESGLPVADIAPAVAVDEGVDFILDGSASADVNNPGDPADDGALTYLWEYVSGPAVNVVGANTAETVTLNVPEVGAVEGGVLVMQLIVTDNDGLVDIESVEVPIAFDNTAPVIGTPPDATVTVSESQTLAEPVVLGVIASDPDVVTDGDELRYQWTVPAGFAVTGENTPTLTILGTPDVGPQAPLEGESYLFTVTVSDLADESAQASSTVNVTFVNQAPIAVIAGSDLEVLEGSVVTLDGSGSSDPDGQAITYAWDAVDIGFGVPELTDANAATSSFTAPLVDADAANNPPKYRLRLNVNDGELDTDLRDVVDVQVLPYSPPDAFDFADMTGVAPGLVHASEPVTISGLVDGSGSPIAVTGGEYSINAGAFTAEAGVVRNGDQLVVRVQAPSEMGAESAPVTVTIGNSEVGEIVSADFKITTGTSELALLDGMHRKLVLTWEGFQGVTHYELYAGEDGVEPTLVTDQIAGDATAHAITEDTGPVHLIDWKDTAYRLRPCNELGCGDVQDLDIALLANELSAKAIGYLKASNPASGAQFAFSVAISEDGTTLVVGSSHENSAATGIDGDQDNSDAVNSGAVYVFVRDDADNWIQQAYIKASNTDAGDQFGSSVSLSADGGVLAVSSELEDSSATGIGGDQDNNDLEDSGAVYVFTRDASETWSQRAYMKASNPEEGAHFGSQVSLADDGRTLAVGSQLHDGAFLVNGAAYVYVLDDFGSWSEQAYLSPPDLNQGEFGGSVSLSGDGNRLAVGAHREFSEECDIGRCGAAYIFRRNGESWQQEAQVGASNPGSGDDFGISVSLSNDGRTLAVGSSSEDSFATGINGPQGDSTSGAGSGAVYLYALDDVLGWSQTAYVKPSNTDSLYKFSSAALSGDGNILVVGARGEKSASVGVQGDQASRSEFFAGAAYVFVKGETGDWVQASYLKASNTEASDQFGELDAVAVTGDGGVIAIGAYREDSTATGIAGDQQDDSVQDSGAVYVY